MLHTYLTRAMRELEAELLRDRECGGSRGRHLSIMKTKLEELDVLAEAWYHPEYPHEPAHDQIALTTKEGHNFIADEMLRLNHDIIKTENHTFKLSGVVEIYCQVDDVSNPEAEDYLRRKRIERMKKDGKLKPLSPIGKKEEFA